MRDYLFIYPILYRKLKRGPQVILPKDIGMILAYAQVSKEYRCVDAGTGSGWLAVALARTCKEVYSYDVREDFLKIAEKNKEIAGVDNLYLKKGDVFRKIDERDVDLVTLDLPNPEKSLSNVKKCLKGGGMIVCYLPNIEQVKAYAKRLAKLGFIDIYTVESIVRDILVRDEGTRPSTKGIWHTGYITFARKP